MPVFNFALAAAVSGAALIGGALQGFTGFGFALVAVPMMGFFMPPLQALPYAMVMQALLGAAGLPGAIADCRWRLLGWLGLGVALGTPAGLWILTLVSPILGRLIVGVVVLAACAAIAAGLRLRPNHRLRAAIGAGVLSGLMNGLAGMSGPPAVALLSGAGASSKETRATMMVFVFGAALVALTPFAVLGKLDRTMLAPLAPAAFALAAGLSIGGYVFRRTTAASHRLGAIGVLAALGVTTVMSAALALLRR